MAGMRGLIGVLLWVVGYAPMVAQARGAPCAVNFSVAFVDSLGNLDVGLTPDDDKWIRKFLAKHYDGICYVAPSPDVKILFRVTASSQTETVVPRVTTVPVYTLQVMDARSGKPVVIRTFQRSNAGASAPGLPGLIAAIGNPKRGVIIEAVDWIANSSIDLTTEPPPTTAQRKQPAS